MKKAPFFTHLMERDTPMKEGVVKGEVTLNLSSKVEEILGHSGKMISASKSFYLDNHPDNVVFFNACIFLSSTQEQIWFGDLDLTLDVPKLQEVADAIEKTIVVTRETPFRFDGLKKGIERANRDAKLFGKDYDRGYRVFFPKSQS